MNKKIFLNNTYKSKRNGYIYYVLDKVIRESYKKDEIYILYGDFPISGNQLYVMAETQFLEEFNICSD